MQSKLLRVLESGEFRRIGSDAEQKTNVRVIGATNRDLLKMSREKTFREDLYYRLNVLPMSLPALRERKEDITELADYFLAKFNRKYAKRFSLTELQRQKLMGYSWPGNVRELRNIIERYVVTGNEHVIFNLESEDENVATVKVSDIPQTAAKEPMKIIPLKEKMEKLELDYIRSVLTECGHNVQKTADELGVHRSLIYRKLQGKQE